jgi:hypothetical protein
MLFALVRVVEVDLEEKVHLEPTDLVAAEEREAAIHIEPFQLHRLELLRL